MSIKATLSGGRLYKKLLVLWCSNHGETVEASVYAIYSWGAAVWSASGQSEDTGLARNYHLATNLTALLSLLSWSHPVRHESLPELPKDYMILMLSKSAWQVILNVYKYISLFKADKLLLIILKRKVLFKSFKFNY